MSAHSLPSTSAARLVLRLSAALQRSLYAVFAILLFIVLFVVNAVLQPGQFSPGGIGATVGLVAPLILAAVAATPPILGGGGGIDLSVGPLMGLVNAIVVAQAVLTWHVTTPVVLVPLCLAIGAVSGLINGVLATVVRLQPIVATLATYLVYTGLTLIIAPTPIGPVPGWIAALAGGASVIPLILVLVAWWLITRTTYYEALMATGGDDRAAYTSGIRVPMVRLTSYLIGGVFAGVAGLALTALLGSVDPSQGPTYTLTAIAAVALGGVSLAGGRGGVAGAVVGAVDIYLIQDVLTYFNTSSFTVQVAYGAVLVLAVALNPIATRRLAQRGVTA